MSDPPSSDVDLDAVAASLSADARDAAVFFPVLCEKLLGAFPGGTTVERDHHAFHRDKPARSVTVHVGDDTFEAHLDAGVITCRHTHAVHGVGGGMPFSRELPIADWLRALVTAMAGQAGSNAEAAATLRTLVT